MRRAEKLSKVLLTILVITAVIIIPAVRGDQDLPPPDSGGDNSVIVSYNYLAKFTFGNSTVMHVTYDDYKGSDFIVLLLYDNMLNLVDIAKVKYNDTYVYSDGNTTIGFYYDGLALKVINATVVDLIKYVRHAKVLLKELAKLRIHIDMQQTIEATFNVVQDLNDLHKVQLKVATGSNSRIMLLDYDVWYKFYTHTWLKITKDQNGEFVLYFHSYYKIEPVRKAYKLDISIEIPERAYVNETIRILITAVITYPNGTKINFSGLMNIDVYLVDNNSLIPVGSEKVYVDNGTALDYIVINQNGTFVVVVSYDGFKAQKSITVIEKIEHENPESIWFYVVSALLVIVVIVLVYLIWVRISLNKAKLKGGIK